MHTFTKYIMVTRRRRKGTLYEFIELAKVVLVLLPVSKYLAEELYGKMEKYNVKRMNSSGMNEDNMQLLLLARLFPANEFSGIPLIAYSSNQTFQWNGNGEKEEELERVF